MAGCWAPVVHLEAGADCVQHEKTRALEAQAIQVAGARLASGPVPSSWFKSYWPELATIPQVDFQHIEAVALVGVEQNAAAA